jgi:hypothetical protein
LRRSGTGKRGNFVMVLNPAHLDDRELWDSLGQYRSVMRPPNADGIMRFMPVAVNKGHT